MDQRSKRPQKSTSVTDKEKKPKQSRARKTSSGKTPKKKEELVGSSKTSQRKPPLTSSAEQKLVYFEELGARIARRAYELYEQRGGIHGHDRDDWLEAERQILVKETPKGFSSSLL